MKNNLRNEKGITLVALVVTIIVLLILAGVSLSLVMGNNGILGKATKAVDETSVAAAKEQAGLLISDLQADYYEAKYVNKATVAATVGAYIQTELAGEGKTTADYQVKIADGNVEVWSTGTNAKKIVSGTLDATSGKVTDWTVPTE